MANVELKKRIRSVNFTDAEEELLVQLVLNRKNIIECKASDTFRTEDKCKAWEAVAAEFNAICINTVSVIVATEIPNTTP